MIKLQVKGLTKNFGPKKVLAELSFESEGTTLGIAGSNGSGKSTLLKCLGRLLSPSRGNITWSSNGQELSADLLQQKLGYAAPYINLYEELSCRENLTFLAKLRHANKEANPDYWLEKTQIASVANQPFGKLSTGQQQRLRLASALFHEPNILLLDEPGSNLDEAGRRLVNDMAQSYQSPGKMLVIASNDDKELSLCHQVFSVEEQQFR